MTISGGEDSWSFAGDIPEGDGDGTPPSSDPGSSASLPGIRTPKVGDRFGPYLILSELGSGGMGVVYRARDTLGGREVALKILSARRMSPRQRDRFKREGELTATLRHSGIVRIHAGGEIKGVPYLAYELVKGGRTLADVLDDVHPLRAAELLRNVATAVGFAHRHGVVHRDLKPENVLIDERGNPRVADFGLAWAEGQDRLTRTGALVGTPAFMAPEQFNTHTGEVGPWTDVWAMGIMLYRGLTREAPFQANNLVELAARVCQSDPESPRAKNSEVSLDLEAICLKALERVPAHRYQNGELLAADLTALLSERPVSASSVRWRWRRRKKSLKRLFVVLGFVAVVAAISLVWEPAETQRREAEAVRLIEDFRRGQAERQQLESTLVTEPPLSPPVQASLHLALAGGEAKTKEGWQQRALHAEEAFKLAKNPSLQGQACRARGHALDRLGLYALADEAYTRASNLSDDPELLLELGHTRLRAERHDTALLAAEAYLTKRPGELAGYVLLVRVQVGRERYDLALKLAHECLELNPGPDSHILVAEAMHAGGADAPAFLRKARADWPTHDGLALALAEIMFVGRGEARVAADILNTLGGTRSERSAMLLRCLTDLGCLDTLGAPPRIERFKGAPADWGEAAANWMLAEARREQAFIERLDEPLVPRIADAIPPGDRLARARRYLLAIERLDPKAELTGRAQITWARLEGPTTKAGRTHLTWAQSILPADPEYLLLRGEERLAAGEAEAAVTALEGAMVGPGVPHRRRSCALASAYLEIGRANEAAQLARAAQPWLLDAGALDLLAQAEEAQGRKGEAEAARARATLLRERPQQQEVPRLFRGAPGSRDDADDQLNFWSRLAAKDPGSLRCNYEVAKSVYKTGSRLPGLRGIMWGVSRSALYLSDVLRDIVVLAHATPSGTDEAIPWLITQLQPLTRSREDLQILAMLSTQAVECGLRNDWVERAFVATNDAIAEDLGNPTGYIFRAFLHIRSRQFVQASRDLRIAGEASPDCASVVFYESLLAAAQGNMSEARAHLARLRSLKFEPVKDNAWSRQYYPEMAPYAKKRGFELFQHMAPRRD